MPDADEDRQTETTTGQRPTRRDILHDSGSSTLWVPHPDCGDRFSPPPQQIKHTHCQEHTPFPVRIWSCGGLLPLPPPFPGTVCNLVGEVRVGGAREKGKESEWRGRGGGCVVVCAVCSCGVCGGGACSRSVDFVCVFGFMLCVCVHVVCAP